MMPLMLLREDAGWIAGRRIWPLFLILTAIAGCGKAPPPAKPVDVEPHVTLVKPPLRTISRTVGQPGFIYAYEQTAIYSKVAGYVLKWKVDIGDPIKKDQEIATLFVPELDAELLQKKAQVELDEAQILVAEQMVEVATINVKVAAAQVEEAKAGVNKFQAGVDRWESEVKRLTDLAGGESGVIDKQVLGESRKQLKVEIASREAAKSTVVAAEATQLARKADVDKAKADVVAARAKAQASRADVQRVAALVAYTHITAPYDGIVVVRNVNTKDYVQPGSGDQSVSTVAPGQSTAHAPLYVVARTDKVRVYVDIPEMDASSVTRGTQAHVRVQALRDEEIPATVTRTSWSLQRETRTLRAEIDLDNPTARLLPGMYAYGKVLIHHSDVHAIPEAAVVELGNQNCCYLYEDGKAVQTPVQTGISDGKWVEAAKKRVGGTWTDFTGEEKVILGDLSELTDGQKVKVIEETGDKR
jgi:HlyD family secretion protein